MRTQINGKVSTRVLTKRKASVQSTNSHKHRSIAGWTWMCVIQSVLLGLVREWTTTVSNHQTRKWTHNNNINRYDPWATSKNLQALKTRVSMTHDWSRRSSKLNWTYEVAVTPTLKLILIRMRVVPQLTVVVTNGMWINLRRFSRDKRTA